MGSTPSSNTYAKPLYGESGIKALIKNIKVNKRNDLWHDVIIIKEQIIE